MGKESTYCCPETHEKAILWIIGPHDRAIGRSIVHGKWWEFRRAAMICRDLQFGGTSSYFGGSGNRGTEYSYPEAIKGMLL